MMARRSTYAHVGGVLAQRIAHALGALSDNSSAFSATFSAIAVSAAQDAFEIVAPSNRRVSISSIVLGQYSDAGDAQAELLSVTLVKGYTTSGSGGASVTPQPLGGWLGTPLSAVERNNTTVATNGSPVVMHADVLNVAAGWWYSPHVAQRIVLEVGERLIARISAPADALTMNGTLIFEELPA